MVKGKPKNGKRTRRTRQQMLLEAEAALSNRKFPLHMTSSYFNEPISPTATPLSAAQPSTMIDPSSGNAKKSLRILFQNAKSGKGLSNGRQRQTPRNMNYRWPRTVEAAQSPFLDPTGKNKMFFVLAINLYPENKIVQPSDSETESEEEANNEPINYTSDHHTTSSPDISKASTIDANTESAVSPDILNYTADEAFFQEKSVSPVSPKVKRGRRPTNARRIPYGRAADIDHSWRSNYNRRCIQRRTHKQARNRIKDPQVILDVINTVVERFAVGIKRPDSVGKNDNSIENSFINNRPRLLGPPRTPPKELLEENLYFIKQEIVSPEPSDVEVDVVDDEEEYVSVENDDPADKDYVGVYGDYEGDEDEYDEDDDEENEIVVL